MTGDYGDLARQHIDNWAARRARLAAVVGAFPQG